MKDDGHVEKSQFKKCAKNSSDWFVIYIHVKKPAIRWTSRNTKFYQTMCVKLSTGILVNFKQILFVNSCFLFVCFLMLFCHWENCHLSHYCHRHFKSDLFKFRRENFRRQFSDWLVDASVHCEQNKTFYTRWCGTLKYTDSYRHTLIHTHIYIYTHMQAGTHTHTQAHTHTFTQ